MKPYLLVIALVTNMLLYVPFINFLYKVKMQRAEQYRKDVFGKDTPIFNQLHAHKKGVPNGGGVLVVLITIITYWIASQRNGISSAEEILLLTATGFSVLGLIDDIKKTFKLKGRLVELRAREKFLLQTIIATIITHLLIQSGIFDFLGSGFISNLIAYPLLTFLIVFISNAFNITDGLDGLAIGAFLLSLIPLLLVAHIRDNIEVANFIYVVMGGSLAFMYFNINPARLFMGDAGALAFGALLVVLAVLLQVTWLIPFICFLYIVEAGSSLLQWFSKAVFKKKLFTIAPIHHNFEAKGWPETKVVFRFWWLQIVASASAMAVYELIMKTN